MKRSYLNTAVKAALLAPAVGLITPAAIAQESDDNVEVIQVRGIVSSLKRALSDKKESAIVSDGIAAEDLGKFPDLNVPQVVSALADAAAGTSTDVTAGIHHFGDLLTWQERTRSDHQTLGDVLKLKGELYFWS